MWNYDDDELDEIYDGNAEECTDIVIIENEELKDNCFDDVEIIL